LRRKNESTANAKTSNTFYNSSNFSSSSSCNNGFSSNSSLQTNAAVWHQTVIHLEGQT